MNTKPARVQKPGDHNAETRPRPDYRRVSIHLDARKPAYYLVLLRSKAQNRSLRAKPLLVPG